MTEPNTVPIEIQYNWGRYDRLFLLVPGIGGILFAAEMMESNTFPGLAIGILATLSMVIGLAPYRIRLVGSTLNHDAGWFFNRRVDLTALQELRIFPGKATTIYLTPVKGRTLRLSLNNWKVDHYQLLCELLTRSGRNRFSGTIGYSLSKGETYIWTCHRQVKNGILLGLYSLGLLASTLAFIYLTVSDSPPGCPSTPEGKAMFQAIAGFFVIFFTFATFVMLTRLLVYIGPWFRYGATRLEFEPSGITIFPRRRGPVFIPRGSVVVFTGRFYRYRFLSPTGECLQELYWSEEEYSFSQLYWDTKEFGLLTFPEVESKESTDDSSSSGEVTT